MLKIQEDIIQNHLIVDGLILSKSNYIFCTERLSNKTQRKSVSYIFGFQSGRWEFIVSFNMQPVSIAPSPDKDNEYFVLGREGECVRISDGNIEQCNISSKHESMGPFRKIKNIAGTIYVLGEDSSLWQLKLNQWQKIRDSLDEQKMIADYQNTELNDDDFFNELIEDTEISFSFSGGVDNEMVLVGTGGEIIFFNGTHWQEQDSPTNTILYDIHRRDAGDYIICGSQGMLISGQSPLWKVINLDGVSNDFCNLTEHQGVIYLADGHAVYKLENDKLVKVDFGSSEKIPAHVVTSQFGVILALAAKEVIISDDGINWNSLLF